MGRASASCRLTTPRRAVGHPTAQAECHEANLTLFEVRRAHPELYGRLMEESGQMRSTVPRRLSTLASLLQVLRAGTPRRPQPRPQRPPAQGRLLIPALVLDRNELGAFLVQAGLGSARDHALASLLTLNGLRIYEALGVAIGDLDSKRRHRTAKGRQAGDHPPGFPTSRPIDLYIGERTTGPIFLGANGGRMDRYAADRTVKRPSRRAGIAKRISTQRLRHSFIDAAMCLI